MTLHVTAKIVQGEESGNYFVKIPAFDIDEDIGNASFERLIEKATDLLQRATRDLQIPAVDIDEPEITVTLKFSIEGQKDRKLSEFSEGVAAGAGAK